MGTEATGLRGKMPALFLVRARSRASRVVDMDDDAAVWWPATPPLRPPVAVPFLWEVVPGKPKPQTHTAHGAPPAAAERHVHEDGGAAATGGGDHDGDAEARPVPLKLPPRLQVTTTAADNSLSPKTVLQGPYGCTGGAKRPPRTLKRSGSVATFRRSGFFSRRKATAAMWTNRKGGHENDAAAPDASCCSPAASSASSPSSSSSVSCFGDDHGHGGHERPADGRVESVDSEEDVGAKASVRITRFRRNRSLPSMTTSHLWASIRKSVRQITPWS
ncbi:uncharacterized protein LOC133913808 isoform X2 [Phragmites australis]|uniref:uncharacterized protein LOC133913808 isoform X2 n=1 Tax=Phragmites australis TaxID=29695 RepID=UPI002D78C8A9|nr:uncharacterized protein LOC133913808 isoform X2 [Phragmites australis]